MKTAVILGISALAWITLSQVILPIQIRNRLPEAVKAACDTCRLEIESVGVGFIDITSISLDGVSLTQGVKGQADTESRVAQIELDVKLAPLFHKQLIVTKIYLENPEIEYTDGEAPKAKAVESKKSDEKSSWVFQVEDFKIVNGKFLYRRILHKEASMLHLHKINVKTKPFGNVEKLKSSLIEMSSTFQLEKSGEIALQVATPLKSDELWIDVGLQIKDQNLSDLNVFFVSNDGVELHGHMIKGSGKVHVRGRELDAEVTTVYKDFSAKMLKNEEQGAVEAFFTNLGIALTTTKKNTHKKKIEQVEETTLEREEGESIVHFILQGLKKAALAVASS